MRQSSLLQAQPPPAAAALEESRELPYNDFIPANRPTPVGVDVEPSLKRALSEEQALAKVTKGVCGIGVEGVVCFTVVLRTQAMRCSSPSWWPEWALSRR